jgi:outer membrane protein assembly factor BamB
VARRRSDGGSFTFDLEPDDDGDGVGAGAVAGVPHGDEHGDEHGDGLVSVEPVAVEPSVLARVVAAAARTLRTWPRRRVIAVGTALGVVVVGAVGTPVALSQARQKAWERTAMTASGAMFDLSHEPVQVWRTELAGAQPVAVVSGTLVVSDPQGEGDVRDRSLHGLDPATGELRWSTVVPDAGECTVGQNLWVSTAVTRVNSGDVLVCVSTTQRRVGVVNGEGTLLASRELADQVPADEAVDGDEVADAAVGDAAVDGDEVDDDAVDWANRAAHRVLVLAGGDLVRIDRLGELGAPVGLGPFTDPVGDGHRTAELLGPLVTRDVRVRVEDAVTGAVRWEKVLDVADLPEGAAVDEGSTCLGWGASGSVADPEGQWSDGLGATRLRLRGCGLDAALDLATGEIADPQGAEDAETSGMTEWLLADVPIPGGGWAALRLDVDQETGEYAAQSHVTGADGTDVGTLPGLLIPPLASDGPRSTLLITSSAWGGQEESEFAAYDAGTAERRWRVPMPNTRLLVRTAETVVVSDGLTVTGLDAATGRTRWEHGLSGPDSPTSPDIAAGLTGATGLQPDGGLQIRDALTDGQRVLIVMPEHPDDSAYSFDGPSALTTLDLATGDVAWEATSQSVPYPVAGRLVRFDADAVIGLG